MVKYHFYVGKPSEMMGLSNFWAVSGNLVDDIHNRVIRKDERVLGIIIGKIENPTPWGVRTDIDKKRDVQFGEGRDGALVCTTRRLLFYMPKILGRWEVEAAPLEQVSSVHYNKGMVSSRIHITVFNDEKVIKWIRNKDAKIMIDIIENKLKNIKNSGKNAGDPLLELKMRLVKGEISKEEYLELKKILEM
jgi:hypothetical protein